MAPLVLLTAFAAASLDRAGELMTPEQALELQQSSSFLYNPTFLPGSVYPIYKLKGTIRLRPEVLVMGSSRALSIRGEFADVARNHFYNAAIYGVDSVGTVRQFLENLPQDHLPRLLVLDLDPWWYRAGAPLRPGADYFHTFSRLEILNLSWRNGISLGLNRLRGMEPAPPKKGLRADGSILTKERWLDAHPGLLESQIDDARKGNGFWFVPGAADPSQAAIRETERLLEYCFAHGIAVAGYFSPFHPDLYEAVKINRSLNYFWKIPEALKPVFEKHHASLADLQDPAVPGCAGDEFLDTQHESDVCSTRVMLALGAHDNRLRQVFRPEMLSKFLEQRKSSWQLGF